MKIEVLKMKDEAFDFRTFRHYQYHVNNNVNSLQNNYLAQQHLNDHHQLPSYNYMQKLITMTSTSSSDIEKQKSDIFCHHLNTEIENDVIYNSDDGDGIREPSLFEDNLIYGADKNLDENIFDVSDLMDTCAVNGEDHISPTCSESRTSSISEGNFQCF